MARLSQWLEGLKPIDILKIGQSKGAGYFLAIFWVAVVTAVLAPFRLQINSTSTALSFLLVVLFIAAGWGSSPAYLASAMAMLCFNFFFLAPVYSLRVADPQNWVALLAFLITALTAGKLSADAKRRAEEAENGRRKIEELYHKLQLTFDRLSRAEALRQSEQLKSALLDSVTHDLRTPLTSIKASVSMLLEERRRKADGASQPSFDDEGFVEMLVVIDEEAERLNHFIEGMVELARIEAGNLQLRRRWSSADEIISIAIARAKPFSQQHRIEVELKNELPLMWVDARAVAEIIYLLIDNATKYSPPNTKIKIQASRTRDDSILVAIEDEGPGIPIVLRERVFDKFFRATSEYTAPLRRPAGIGMGLAITRGIVDAHHGRIWIEDAPSGRGARIVFTLPMGDEERLAPDVERGVEAEPRS